MRWPEACDEGCPIGVARALWRTTRRARFNPRSPAVNIDKFKHQHLDILRSIDLLRQLTHAGVERNAAEIAQRIVAMSSTIKLHLAVEDQALYPALQRSGNASLARMGRQYPKRHGPDRQRLRRLCAPLEHG